MSIMCELNIDKIRATIEQHQANPLNVVMGNAFQMSDFNKLTINSKVLDQNNHIFSNTIKTDVKTMNQDQAGLCWMCGGMTICRRAIIDALSLDEDFNFSLNYLLFWDKLEKANCKPFEG